MFRIDHAANRITKLKQVRFSELGFGERTHLQEWLANAPEALGEELLIIQKEFAGFDDTKERLDLLALDKSGALVIIENKLDDSGRDVVWQSLKYASYCSSLSKSSIADIYQRYLDAHGTGENARKRICEFIGQEDFNDISLNTGNDQRLIMVAAQFRKEVTSTVLWLMKHNVKIECFKATPYQYGTEVILNLEQVIPLPEAEEFMIGIAEKEQEEHAVEKIQIARYTLRREFWQKTLEALEAAHVDLFENVGTTKDNWLSTGSGLGGVHYSMVFNRDMARVEFVLSRSTKERNKAMFDYLLTHREQIETAFGAPLEWRRLDENKVSIIGAFKSFDGHQRESWPAMIEWLVVHVPKLERAFAPHISSLRDLLKTKSGKPSHNE